MAIGIATTSARGLQYDGRLTFYVILASIVAASGGLLFGYDIGVTGGVTSMDEFLDKFFPEVHAKQQSAREDNYCKFNSQILQLFTSSLFLAGMVGGIFGSWTTSRFGRTRTMLLSSIFFLGGAGLTGGAINLGMLVAGRISLGLGVGLANQTVPLYLSEVAPANRRGMLNQAFQFMTTIGILVAQCINYKTQDVHPWGWRLSLVLAGVPAAMLMLGGLFLHDSPNSLVYRGKRDEGERVLVKLRGTPSVKSEFDDIVTACDEAQAATNQFSNILKRKYRPQLVFAIAIPIFQQLTGINAIMFYVAPLFKTLGFAQNAALLSALITGGVNVVATLVSIFTVDRFGRKPLFGFGGGLMIISQVFIGCLLATWFGPKATLDKTQSWVIVAFICIYVAGFACSWGPLGWLVPSEIQPLETRSASQGLTVATNFLFTFIIGQSFLSMLCAMKFGIFLFFAGWVVIMTACVYLFLPETKNQPVENMGRIWRMHWYWARIVPPPEQPAVGP
eukprot:jgi/Mesen1/5076/ME000252S04197